MRNPYGVTVDNIPDADTFCRAGNDIQLLYELVSDNGCDYLVETGRQSISTMINAWRDCTDMSYILSRLNAGDASVLNVRPDAFYGDVSDMPYDHRAALTAITNARTYFDHLPDDIRAKFDDDFQRWFSEAGDDAWIDKMVRNAAPAEGADA